MMGVSLFGTCTMKYNPRLATELVARPEIAELHPEQDDDTLQGILELVHGLDLILRGVSGMDAFVFQPGGGAHAAYTHAVITRAYHAARGEPDQRDEVVTTIQAHPCNAATAARGGIQDRHAAARGERLSVTRCAQGGRLGADGVPDGGEPGRHGRLQPRDRQVGRGRARRRRALLLRPRELQRRDGEDQGARARVRRVHVHAPQDVRRTEGRRRPGRRRLRLHGGAGSLPARARRRARRRPLPARPRPARLRRQGSRVLGQRAAARLRVHLESRDGRRGNQRGRPTSPCSPTTTWRRGSSRSAASRSRSRI